MEMLVVEFPYLRDVEIPWSTRLRLLFCTRRVNHKIYFFSYPKKKPITYKVQSKTIEKSTILKQKDFEKAKETIKFIKARKWNSALKSAKKVKDSEFRTLITWMHVKTTQNSASFNDYKNFIEQHEDYPRINRIKNSSFSFNY